MNTTINIYCDESCHLPRDGQKAMVLGALWCLKVSANEHHRAIAELKAKHGLSPFFEIKWTKISPSKLDFYCDLVNYFFDSRNLGFRAWVVPDKAVLSHDEYDQTHDDWHDNTKNDFRRKYYSCNYTPHLIHSDGLHCVLPILRGSRCRMGGAKRNPSYILLPG